METSAISGLLNSSLLAPFLDMGGQLVGVILSASAILISLAFSLAIFRIYVIGRRGYYYTHGKVGGRYMYKGKKGISFL